MPVRLVSPVCCPSRSIHCFHTATSRTSSIHLITEYIVSFLTNSWYVPKHLSLCCWLTPSSFFLDVQCLHHISATPLTPTRYVTLTNIFNKMAAVLFPFKSSVVTQELMGQPSSHQIRRIVNWVIFSVWFWILHDIITVLHDDVNAVC